MLNQAVYSLIKELEVQTDRRVKGEVRCRCKHECGVRCKCGVKCEHRGKCKCGARCKCECEARAQSEICQVGCILFVLFLSVCTGELSTKAMVGVDIAARVP